MTKGETPTDRLDTPVFQGRNALLAFSLLFCIAIAFYHETTLAMVGIWMRSDTFAHAFVVPLISAWLVWRVRVRLQALRAEPSLIPVLMMGICGFVWLLAELATVGVVTQYMLIATLVLLVPAIFGWRMAKQVCFPLFFLFFAVPFGEFALPQLMEWTARFTVMALRLSGIPVYQEGLQFVIPSGNWSVVEACSGVRYLIASLTVGTLFAYLNYTSIRKRLIFVGVSFVVPIFANWLRAYTIVLIGHLSGNALAAGVDHLIYGWLFFGLVILLMFYVGSFWSEEDTETLAPASSQKLFSGQSQPLGLRAFLILIVLAAPHVALWGVQKLAEGQPVHIGELTSSGGWKPSQHTISPPWKPAYANASAEMQLVLEKGEQIVGLYVGYYRQQHYDKKLVSSENVLVKTKDPFWAKVKEGRVLLTFADKEVVTYQAELRAGDARAELQRLVAYRLYWVNGYLTSSEVMAKLLTAITLLTGKGDDGAVVVLYAPKNDRAGEIAVQDFVQSNAQNILTLLADTRDRR